MKFRYFGINFKCADLNLREKVAFTDQKKMDYLMQAEALGINQCLILSTCNRSEVFFYGEEEQAEQMIKKYCRMFSEKELPLYIQKLEGTEALRYFFRVTAGMESLVIGEDQILGQVNEAYEFSRTMGMSKKELNKIVREAVTCAKKIKTELKISDKPLSVSYIGVKMLEEQFGISGRSALVIGSGKMAELVVRYLDYYQAGRITVCSRTLENGKRLLEEFPKIKLEPYENRYDKIKESELIISATAAPHLIVKNDKLQMEPLVHTRHVFLDLATPRDIEPSIGRQPGCVYIDLEVLEKTAKNNRSERENLLKEGEATVEASVLELESWLNSCKVDETIQSLQQKCSEIVEDTYSYLNRKLKLEPNEQKVLKKMLAASLKRLLREPILELKQLDSPKKQEEYQRVVRELFQIHGEEEHEL